MGKNILFDKSSGPPCVGVGYNPIFRINRSSHYRQLKMSNVLEEPVTLSTTAQQSPIENILYRELWTFLVLFNKY